jgi:hypothetical protein
LIDDDDVSARYITAAFMAMRRGTLIDDDRDIYTLCGADVEP